MLQQGYGKFGLAAMAVAAVLVLDGCVAHGVQQSREDEIAKLQKVHVARLDPPPSQSELAQSLGAPSVHRVEDLTLHVYALDFAELKRLHAETKKAGEAPKKPVNPAAYVLLGLFALPGLPFLAADLPFSAAILAVEGDDRSKQLAGRYAVFAYDAAGNYRWQACCPSVRFISEAGVNPLQLPGYPPVAAPKWSRSGAANYIADIAVLNCHQAKAGNGPAQFALSQRFKERPTNLTLAYYWARALHDNQNDMRPGPIERLRKELPVDALRAAEAHYTANPLASLDCRQMAETLARTPDPTAPHAES